MLQFELKWPYSKNLSAAKMQQIIFILEIFPIFRFVCLQITILDGCDLNRNYYLIHGAG